MPFRSRAVPEVTAVQVLASVLVSKVPLAPTAIHRPVGANITWYKLFVVPELGTAVQVTPSALDTIVPLAPTATNYAELLATAYRLLAELVFCGVQLIASVE